MGVIARVGSNPTSSTILLLGRLVTGRDHYCFGDHLLSGACILFCSPEKPLFCKYPTVLHPWLFADAAYLKITLMGNDHGTIYQGHMPLRAFGC